MYRIGYVARLTEQLGETFSAVWRLLGDEDFFTLCESFLRSHPSTSYNLSDYGRDFPGFLAAAEGPGHVAIRPLLAELAGFELLFHDLFHARSHEAVDAATLAALDDLDGVRFSLGSTVRLVSCRHAVYDVFRHRNDSQAPDLDFERSQLVLLFKQEAEVMARELDAGTLAALEGLRDSLTVEEALVRAVEADPAFGEAEVGRLFELMARCGLVSGILR